MTTINIKRIKHYFCLSKATPGHAFPMHGKRILHSHGQYQILSFKANFTIYFVFLKQILQFISFFIHTATESWEAPLHTRRLTPGTTRRLPQYFHSYYVPKREIAYCNDKKTEQHDSLRHCSMYTACTKPISAKGKQIKGMLVLQGFKLKAMRGGSQARVSFICSGNQNMSRTRQVTL